MPQACSTVLLLIGGFFFSIWLSRREETPHLLLAMASIAWCVSNLQYVLPRYDDPLLESAYSAIVNMAVSWFMWLVYLFVLRIDARRTPWVERALPIYVLVMSVLAIPFSGLLFDAGLLFQVANIVVATCVTGLISMRAIRGGSVELRVIAAALLSALLAGTHDIALLGLLLNPERTYLLPFSGLLVFGALLFAVQRRYVAAIDELETLRNSLSSRLAARDAELNTNHIRLLALERNETLAAERQRLMHDMHDGVGSALLSALAAVEQKTFSQEDVAKALRACIDDLRLVIDSLEPMERDLVTLLATIRYRLSEQMAAAGLTLEWDIQDIPKLEWLESSAVLNVLRIVQEGLANTLKHSHATHVRIATLNLGSRIEVKIEDNGCGFDTSLVQHGRGMKSLKRRAKQLQGELQILSESGKGTSLTLELPVARTT